MLSLIWRPKPNKSNIRQTLYCDFYSDKSPSNQSKRLSLHLQDIWVLLMVAEFVDRFAGYVGISCTSGVLECCGLHRRELEALVSHLRISTWGLQNKWTVIWCHQSSCWPLTVRDVDCRRTWKGGHIIAGSSSVFLAFANVFIGLKVRLYLTWYCVLGTKLIEKRLLLWEMIALAFPATNYLPVCPAVICQQWQIEWATLVPMNYTEGP